MIQHFEHSAATPGWHASSRTRPSAMGANESIARPRSRACSPGVEERLLDEAVQACGYDVCRISQYFGISARHLRRWFRAHMACTPGVWLAEQRLQEARRLLTGSSSVKEVAYSLGFRHASQFSRDFKRQFGHQPSAEMARARLAPAV